MLKLSLISASVLIALATAQPVDSAQKEFPLKLKAQYGVPADHGRYLSTFHTGAGENAAIGTKSKADAVKFSYDATHHTLTYNATFPYSIGLSHNAPFNSSATNFGYKTVTVNAGQGTPGFYSSANVHQDFLFKSKAFPEFDAFVLCEVNHIAPYYSAGPQYQLLWRPKKADAIPACSDITLHGA